MAGVVSEHVCDLLRRKAEEYGLVVWFDPDRQYEALTDRLEQSGLAVERHTGSFLDLRRRVEPYLAPEDHATGIWRERPDKVVVYVPLAPEEAQDALVDLTSWARVLAPGQSPWQHNTRLDVVARQALKNKLPPAELDNVVAQVKEGRLKLDDLDRLAEQSGGARYPRVALIFRTAEAKAVALEFLVNEGLDAALAERDAIDELGALLTDAFDLPRTTDTTPADLRARLARHALLTDLINSLGDLTPDHLRSVPVPRSGDAQRALLSLVDTWRNRFDLAESYAKAADTVARELGTDMLANLPLAALKNIRTFAETDQALQSAIEQALRDGSEDRDELIAEASRRANQFWARHRIPIRDRWLVIVDAGRLLTLADTIRTTLKRRKLSVEALLRAYAEGEQPWCWLDTYHRHMLRRYHDLDTVGEATTLDQLVIVARRHHATAVADLAEAFTSALEDSAFNVGGMLAQSDIFSRHVAPLLNESYRTAYVLVDALRFEMARELATHERLKGWNATLSYAIATFPTITKIGMAALMPGAERGLTLSGQGRQLTVEIGGTRVNTREERVALLDHVMPNGWVECKLGEIRSPSLRKRLEEAPAAFVTSQEIDEIAESGNAPLARQVMDTVLQNLVRGLATLHDCGFERVVVAADHGYLFGDDVSEGEKIDPPGGDTIELHRRVWVGRGGSAAPGVLRVAAADLGLGGDVEFATPRGLGVFYSGGATDYFHGGLSLQELVIPVLELSLTKESRATSALEWEIVPGSKTISTRFFSVTIRASARELLPVEPPRIQVELRQGTTRIGDAKAGTYGFDDETGVVQLRLHPDDNRVLDPNTVTLMVTADSVSGEASVVVSDAVTGRELARLDGVPITIAF